MDAASEARLARIVGWCYRALPRYLAPFLATLTQADIEEVVATVAARAAARLTSLDGDGIPVGYLRTAARNAAIDLTRRAGARPTTVSLEGMIEWLADQADWNGGEELARVVPVDPGLSVEDEVLHRLQLERVQQALATLPAEQRRVLLLTAAGWTNEEIAARTGAPLGTVKSRLRYARTSLRRTLGEEERSTEGRHA